MQTTMATSFAPMVVYAEKTRKLPLHLEKDPHRIRSTMPR